MPEVVPAEAVLLLRERRRDRGLHDLPAVELVAPLGDALDGGLEDPPDEEAVADRAGVRGRARASPAGSGEDQGVRIGRHLVQPLGEEVAEERGERDRPPGPRRLRRPELQAALVVLQAALDADAAVEEVNVPAPQGPKLPGANSGDRGDVDG